MALGHPTQGLHDVALGGPTAILDECQACLGHSWLARWGICLLLCPGACSSRKAEAERERSGEESPDHRQSKPNPTHDQALSWQCSSSWTFLSFIPQVPSAALACLLVISSRHVNLQTQCRINGKFCSRLFEPEGSNLSTQENVHVIFSVRSTGHPPSYPPQNTN